MPPEKRALDTDNDHLSASKKSKREADDQPRDWRAAHFDNGAPKRKHKDQDSRDKGFDRDRQRDRSYDRPREKERSHRSGQESHGSSLNPRHHEKYENTPDSRRDSIGRAPPSAPKAMLHLANDEREEGEISPRPTEQNSSMMETNKTVPQETTADMELVENKLAEDDAEARKARRAAILAKYQSGGPNTPQLSNNDDSLGPNPLAKLSRMASGVASVATPAPSTPFANNTGAAPSPIAISQDDGQFMLSKDPNSLQSPLDEGLDARAQIDGGVEGVAAADYDPSKDMRDDVRKAAQLANDAEMVDGHESEYEDEENADDIDDMFAIDDDAEKKPKKKRKRKDALKKPLATVPDTMDTAADEEGYYQIILGEQLDGGRYKVYAFVGKGMFSNVVRAREYDLDAEDKEKPIGEVCVKIVRSQESMYKAGLKEAQILQKLRQGDPEDKKHLVKMERTFEHRGHLCLVFESLSMNLRDTVKKYGRDVGLHLKAVRVYAHQLFLALSLLRKCNILHADIKPDNILINESRSNLKLCDLGSAADVSFENTAVAITPYLVSRFYRAPEIILGLPYECAVDVWSMGCTLYELYTGRILFPGRSNREMLKLMMEVKGRFNQRVVKKAKFGNAYFDDGGGFWDVMDGGGLDMSKKLHFTKPTRDLRSRLVPNSRAVDDVGGEEKELLAFVDLLDKCLQLDSTRRITPKEALNHPFIRGI